MILRQTLTTHPPTSRYYDTVTGRTWFDHAVFEDRGVESGVFLRAMAAEMQGTVDDLAVKHGIEWNHQLLFGDDDEEFLRRYHDQVLSALERGDPVP